MAQIYEKVVDPTHYNSANVRGMIKDTIRDMYNVTKSLDDKKFDIDNVKLSELLSILQTAKSTLNSLIKK